MLPVKKFKVNCLCGEEFDSDEDCWKHCEEMGKIGSPNHIPVNCSMCGGKLIININNIYCPRCMMEAEKAELNGLRKKIREILVKANNTLYLGDSSDYKPTLHSILKLVGGNDDEELEFIDDGIDDKEGTSTSSNETMSSDG
jgi:hypothetical protein